MNSNQQPHTHTPAPQPQQYDLFETVTSSDHRPVALAMELLVQREVVGFEHVRDTKQPHPHQQQPGGGGEGRGEGGPSPVVPFYIEAAICLCEVAISGLRASLLKQGRSQIGEIRILYPSLPEDPLKAQRAVLKLHDFVGFDHSRHYGSVPAVARMAAAEPSLAPTAAHAATTQQPPPLVARVTRLFSTITAGSASTGGEGGRRLATVGGGSGGSGNGSGDHHPPGPVPSGVDLLMDPALLKALHCFRWSDATREPSSSSSSSSGRSSPGGGGGGGGGGGSRSHSHERAPVRFATLASLEHSSHALVKLVDKRGEDLGQGVICLRGLIRRVAARNKPRPALPAAGSAVGSGRGDGEDDGGHPGDDALERGQTGSLAASFREEDVLESVTVELSRGGEYRGVLECQVSLRLVGLRPQQLQAIARGSSVVSSVGSPKDGGGGPPSVMTSPSEVVVR